MNQVLIKQGQAVVEQIPAPVVEKGTLLVRVEYSCISVGTELAGVQASSQPLWKKAMRQPEKVKSMFKMALSQGFVQTKNAMRGKLNVGKPTGYSASGVVLEVGEGIDDIKPGDRVACAGAQYAYHAEVIRVPRNLVVRVSGLLDRASASTVTLGAIAMQGLRRLQPTLGEQFVVIGLGILGQLAVQLLKAAGCRVIGIDLDRQRIELAKSQGMDIGIHPGDGSDIDTVMRFTDGIGADGVLITAAARSSEVISGAFRMCRKKGRVVLVGDVGLNLKRADLYEKELDFYISTSYGPGRYDPNYEEKGQDYPISYVRWTENRNMQEYMKLLEEGKVEVGPLISKIYPIQEAAAAYEQLMQPENKPLLLLLSYPEQEAGQRLQRKVMNPAVTASGSGKIRLALLGAGEFAKATHLPNLQALSDKYALHAVMSSTGHNAAETAKQFGARYATTDVEEILRDPEVDAVLIAARHHLHASMALMALRAGKHVLVEKPLCLTWEELAEIRKFYDEIPPYSTAPVLLTGFNRRFSRYAVRMHEWVKDRTNPMILNYRMNAGYVPLDHWTQTEEGGGRNIGEACHIYDLFTYLTGSTAVDIQVSHISPTTGYYSRQDNFIATIKFEDGSIASLTYAALGSKDYPKEQLDIYVDGKNILLHDYTRLVMTGAKAKGIETGTSDKGLKEELEAFAAAIRQKREWPIPLWQQFQATEIALEVEQKLRYAKGSDSIGLN